MSAVLLIGSGGREHALAWKLGLSPKVSRKIVAPGNDAFPPDWERWELADFKRLASRAKEQGVKLAVIGPDNALADGIVDVLEESGIRCFGPTAAAAKIEASKAFAKDVMKAAGVPTADYHKTSSSQEAAKILKSVAWNAGWVVKADGLALGKGVKVCATRDEALKAAEELSALAHGNLVIEEKLVGEEISWLAFCDGENCALFQPARDHKSLFEGGRGPNTGGMGAFSPVPGVPSAWESRMREDVFLPVLREMKKRGTPFRGVLYAGLMCDFARDRFWVLEFNARFGDPEAQVLLARMDGDLYEWCEAAATGRLAEVAHDPGVPPRVPMKPETAVVVVAASAGYPEKPERDLVISGWEAGQESSQEGSKVPDYFAAGVSRRSDGSWVTSGGRVLGAMGLAASLDEARAQAYERLRKVSFSGMQFRRDIGSSDGEARA